MGTEITKVESANTSQMKVQKTKRKIKRVMKKETMKMKLVKRRKRKRMKKRAKKRALARICPMAQKMKKLKRQKREKPWWTMFLILMQLVHQQKKAAWIHSHRVQANLSRLELCLMELNLVLKKMLEDI